MHKRNSIQMSACVFTILALWHAPSYWPGISGIRGISFVALVGLVIANLFRRESFFNAIACPHCGKPAGEFIRREGFNGTRCSHCGKEGHTDLRVIWFNGPVSQRWPR